MRRPGRGVRLNGSPYALLFATGILTASLSAQTLRAGGGAVSPGSPARAAQAIGSVRTIRFETTQGTAMNVDVSPDGTTIVFDLLGDIYAVPVSGGTATRLTSGPAFDTEPVFSPDGGRIAFVSDRSGNENLWVMDRRGEHLRAFTTEITGAVSRPEWLQGSEFVLVARKPDGYWLYRPDGSGTALNPLLPQRARPGSGEVAWSRDGRVIFAVEGVEIRQIDMARGTSELVSQRRPATFSPAVSPDGNWLVFASQHENQTGLRVLDLTTLEQRWLRYPLPDRDNSTVGRGQPALPRFAFTPDRRAIILATGGTFQRLDLRTGALRPIRFRATVEQELAVPGTPVLTLQSGNNSTGAIRDAQRDGNGTRIVFTALGRIWVREGDGSARLLVQSPPGSQPHLQLDPALSPDGQTVAYVTWNDAEGGRLWRVPVNGGPPRQLTIRRGVYRHPVWSGDGTQLAVLREQEMPSRGSAAHIPCEIYVLPADGGADRRVARVAAADRPVFAANGQALLTLARPASQEGGDSAPAVISISLRTGDQDTVAILPTSAAQVALSPDGEKVAYTTGSNVYGASIRPVAGLPPGPVRVTEVGGLWPAVRVAQDGGPDLRWAADGRALTWVRDGALVRLDVAHTLTGAAVEAIPLASTLPGHEQSGSLVLEGATVITMRGDEVLKDAAVLVSGGRIAGVGPRGSVRLPAGAHRIDVTGKTIIPGLIDLWGSVPLARDLLESTNIPLAAYLALGVTTVRAPPTVVGTPDTAWDDAAEYAERIDRGVMIGARWLTPGAVVESNAAQLTSLEAAQGWIRRQRTRGARGIVQQAPLTRQQQQWLAAAAREAGFPLLGETGNLRRALTMVADGYHGIQGNIPDAQLYDDVRRFLAEARAIYVPTLVATTGGPARGDVGTAEEYFHERIDIGQDPTLKWLGLDRSSAQWRVPEDYHFVPVSRHARSLAALGTPVGVGTAGRQPGLGVHWEMWALELGGMSAWDALRAATVTAAQALGLGGELGTIEVGKVADLVVLDGDPLADLRQSRATRYVMRNGALFDAATLAMIWPRVTPPLVPRDTRYDPPPATAPRAELPLGPTTRLTAGAAVPENTHYPAGPGSPSSPQAASRGLPIQPARTVSFETAEATRMNVDLSPDGRTIVFDLLGDIYTVPVTGGRATQVTRGPSFDEYPVWSPDGRQIAYISDAPGPGTGLWVVAANGSGARSITVERATPYEAPLGFAWVEWTPDGQFLMSADTFYSLAGGRHPSAAVPERVRWMPQRFSPDGQYLYFYSPSGVWRLEQKTGDAIQLAHPPGVQEPVVSPDGEWLVYFFGAGSSGGLRIRRLETGEDRWLAYPVDGVKRYVFTPDSKEVIVAYGGKLHRIDVATGEDVLIPFTASVTQELGRFVYHRHRVTNGPLTVRYIRSPDLSPDGRTLVFSALQRLYTMALPAGAPRPLLRQNAGQFQPAYSPDGRWIAYVTFSDVEGGHVWRVPATGGKPVRLTPVAGYYQHPAWSPDGTMLAVLSAGTRDATPDQPSTGTLQRLPSTGGRPRTLLEGVSRATPVTFTPDGQRLLVQEDSGTLVSLRLDGGDRRVLAMLPSTGLFRDPRRIMPSPDGRWVAFVHRMDLYLVPLVPGAAPMRLAEVAGAGAPPVVRLAHDPLDFRWEDGGRRLIWIVGNRLFRIDPRRVTAPAAGNGRSVVPDEVITIDLVVPRHTARGTRALRGARVITMRGEEVLENATIVITNDRITAIGPSSSVAVPRGARVLDLRGKTIMPGLIDLHAHFTPHQYDEVFRQSDWKLLINLAYGVTTARDVSHTTTQFGIAERIETGQLVGPRLFTVGKSILAENGDSSVFHIASLDDARLVVQHRKAMGAVVVKQYTNPTRRQRQWIFQAADEAGLNVTNEGAWNTPLMLTMVQDGATGLEHMLGERQVYGDVTRLMAEARTWYTPTLPAGPFGAELYFEERHHDVYRNPKYRRFGLPRRSGQIIRPGDRQFEGFVDVARGAADVAHQGGHVTVGSHGDRPGIGVHWELWGLRMGGLSNHEALRVATLGGAEGLGMQQDLGSLEVDKIADLLVLDENPLDRVEHTFSIRYVMKNGVLYEGDTMNTLWPKKETLPVWMYQHAF